MPKNTGYDFNDIDLCQIFSSNTGNNNMANYYNNLSNLDLFNAANNVLKGSAPVGFKYGGTDIVTVFSPIYNDITTSSISTVTIPNWANKVGFIIQAGGGSGGINFTDYWVETSIPLHNEYANQNVYRFQYGNQYPIHFVFTGRFFFGGPGSNFGHNDNYTTNYSHFFTTFYSHNYLTSYYRQNYMAAHSGSGGGGGACTAGVYVVNQSDVPGNMTISHNFNNSYSSIQFNDSLSTSATANCGSNVTANTSTGVSNAPSYVNFAATNTSADSPGLGGLATTNSSSRITNYYSVPGSNGGQGSTSTAGSSGVSGIGNDSNLNASNIINNFIPNISTSSGTGGIGSNTTLSTAGDNGIIRYWFIR